MPNNADGSRALDLKITDWGNRGPLVAAVLRYHGDVTSAYYAAGHMDDAASLDSVLELFDALNPGYSLRAGHVRGEEEWQSLQHGRVRWIQEGSGEIWLARGYRTKEGDGQPLPPEYETEKTPPEWAAAVRYAATRMDSFSGELRAAISSICSRLRGDRYTGDAANDLWAWIEYKGVPSDRAFGDFIALFEALYDQVGFSVKKFSGWERVQAGDQIVVGEEPLRVRGNFRYWEIATPAPIRHIPAVRRLRYLKDTAGGCNFEWNAFRRMPLTYYAKRGITAENPDGVNQVNAHFVNIAAETSRAHYHPRRAVGGGKPQGEFYFAADPGVYGLSTCGRSPGLTLWPEVEEGNADLSEHVHVPLRPGSVVYITPGTGHRGVDVFANVVVLPGYKPKNQIFIAERSDS